MASPDFVDVLFPVESISRELDFRLVLAAKTIRKGMRIFIAESRFSHELASILPGALYVGKQIFYHRKNAHGPWHYHQVKQKTGSSFLHLSEEGAVFMGEESQWKQLLDLEIEPRRMDPGDVVCTWGDYQRDYYSERNPGSTIVTTGHPRFDLLLPDYRSLYAKQADEIRKKYGRFVLVNTNFSLAIHPKGPGYVFSSELRYNPNDADSRRFCSGIFGWSLSAAGHYVRLIHELALRNPKTKIVLRPHPSEEMTFYQTTFGGVSNIEVVREGPVVPWLIASECLVHNGCTTGLEAFLLQKPVISYSPDGDEYTPYLTRNVGFVTTKQDEAIEMVQRVMESKDGDTRFAVDTTWTPLQLALLSNIQSPAFPRLMAQIETALERRVKRKASPSIDEVRGLLRNQNRIELAKNVLRPFSETRRTGLREWKSRFPGFEERVVQEKTRRVVEATGRSFEVRFHGPRLLELSSEG